MSGNPHAENGERAGDDGNGGAPRSAAPRDGIEPAADAAPKGVEPRDTVAPETAEPAAGAAPRGVEPRDSVVPRDTVEPATVEPAAGAAPRAEDAPGDRAPQVFGAPAQAAEGPVNPWAAGGAWPQNAAPQGGTPGGGYAAPPLPAGPPPLLPPPAPAAPAAPPAPPDGVRQAAVAVLNLSGLGLGYAVTRRWFAMLVCWAATAGLLFAALPADADGVSGGVVVAYLAFLVLAAAHGAARARRTRLVWPARAPLALLLGLVLLAAPAGAVVAYGGAKDEATQKMLLERLDTADHLVQAAKAKPFAAAQPDYRTALAAYRDLSEHHAGSRAARRVPDRLTTYYKTVGAPFEQKQYCDAIAPLTYLRTVPAAFGKSGVGDLASWPDERLATSLYECGVTDLAKDPSVSGGSDDHLSELLTMFPGSPQAAKVEPAVRSAISGAAGGLGGHDPCGATERLRQLATRASALPGDNVGISGTLAKDARKAQGYVQSGTYACGVDQYRSAEFGAAVDTLHDFTKKYPHDKHRALAQKIAIAAEIAEHEPAAGRKLPTTASGGGIPVTVSNDSPESVEVLYTGPVTGSFTLPACGSCHLYATESTARASACKSGKNYPKKTLSLPPGTVYFLHKSGKDHTTPGSDTVTLRYGYLYTECAFTVKSSFSL
ncbi:hypothetical protein [Streptomyces sp. NPDC020917]|uniref:hypothetical protein n=1 Tax=Streptomyces sp. NPDC020917 TaxID=3365102 RepID=UPI00379E596D